VGKVPVYETSTGQRQVSDTEWATMTARTEGTRAAAAGTKAALKAAGMETWRWMAEGQACDDCADNDDEVAGIDDSFPSGDDSPPVHPNCRCVVIPNRAELTGNEDEDNDVP
jgi:SPP1 gp7 family putative phage head morphogenesis protein